MKNKMKLLFLLLVNLCPATLGILLFHLGYLSDIYVILATVCVLIFNYKQVADIKKMMLWNTLLFLTSGPSIILSGMLYQWNVVADTEGLMVIQLFFNIWFVISLFMLLAILARAFYVQKNKNGESIAIGFLSLEVIAVALYFYITISPVPYESCSVWINNSSEIDHTENYEVQIDNDNRSVIIRNKKTKQENVLSEKKLGIKPYYVTLGENYFYVLGDENDDDYDILAQITYDGKINAKRKEKNIISFTPKNGILFLGTDKIENFDDFGGASCSLGQICANMYISETDFKDGKLVECKADKDGICQVGETTLYKHDNYFSTNPPIESYLGENSYYINEYTSPEETKETKWTKLVKNMLAEKGLPEKKYWVDEYQSGEYIYGTANVWYSNHIFERSKLKKSFAYRISTTTEEITVLAEKENLFMIICSEDCVVYQSKNQVICENLINKKSKKLAALSKSSFCEYEIMEDYIKIDNDETYNDCYIQWRNNN